MPVSTWCFPRIPSSTFPDKHALAREVFRVLKPGGVFIASDWLTSHDGEPSAEMKEYLASEDLDFGMASPATYEAALQTAGFTSIVLTNRNPWYREQARRELALLRAISTSRPLPNLAARSSITISRRGAS
jgi:SAM-dependent methyltransferase